MMKRGRELSDTGHVLCFLSASLPSCTLTLSSYYKALLRYPSEKLEGLYMVNMQELVVKSL